MKRLPLVLLSLIILGGCGRRPATPAPAAGAAGAGGPAEKSVTLPEARRGFKTKLARQEQDGEPVPEPPPGLFRVVRYDAPVGKLAAYLTPDPKDGQGRPAIIWITGGVCNTIGNVWSPAPPKNDQSARAFREAGIVMMFPSLRGGNDNPGFQEGLFGEVDDVLAAADFLAWQDYVDPARIYLGGHSTGGTLVFLVAACTNRFRAVFSFGPAHDVRGYGDEYLPFDTTNPRELELRAPGHWVHSLQCPVFVFEGTEQPANARALIALHRASRNPLLRLHPVKGADHFSVLAPVTRLVAGKVLRDTGPAANLAFTEQELNGLFAR